MPVVVLESALAQAQARVPVLESAQAQVQARA